MNQILIIEDDITLNQGLCKALKSPEIQTVSCSSLKAASDQLLCGGISLILLDVNLPDGNGVAFLGEIKSRFPDLPIILLTANDMEADIIKGLEAGADDYITKPFSLAILRARVQAQLRRITSQNSTVLEQTANCYQSGDYLFDFSSMHFSKAGQTIELSKTEQKLLRLLVENAGIALERSCLVDRIWTDGAEFVDENALSVTIKRLRDKLEDKSRIKTVYGIGYMWIKEQEHTHE